MAALTKDQILQADDLKRELVSVPEWGGEVYIRCLTGAERDAYQASVVRMHGKTVEPNMQNATAKLVAMTVCDEKGKRIFTDAEVAALGEKNAMALERVASVAARLSGLSQNAQAALEKN